MTSHGDVSPLAQGVPHISIDGFPGVGKTTMLKLLESWYRVHVIPRYTCRLVRPGESGSREYVFVSKEEFIELGREDFFMPKTINPVELNKGVYFTGIPRVKNWPAPPEGTELILSFFGTKTLFIRQFVPGMKTVFVSHPSSFVVMKRLYDRSVKHGVDPTPKMHKINEYAADSRRYDHIVYNEAIPEECAREIAKIAGLLP